MLAALRGIWEADAAAFPSGSEDVATSKEMKTALKAKMQEALKGSGMDKKAMGPALAFGVYVVENMTGPESFSDTYPFDQRALLEEFKAYMQLFLAFEEQLHVCLGVWCVCGGEHDR